MSKRINENILKIRNLLISKRTINILAGGITLGCALIMNRVNDERPVKLSKDIYCDYVLENDEIEPCYYLEKDAIGTYSLENEHILDLSITKKNLEKVKRINVHSTKTDFNDLKLLPNLEEMEINDFGNLTEEDKRLISKHHNLKRIIINFDTSIFNTECHDMSWINDNVEITLKKDDIINTVFDRLNHEDMFYLFVYNTAYNINKINNDRIKLEIFNQYVRKDLERWNKIMIDTVESFEFTEDTTDEEKIIKIVEYVTDTIEYDQDVIAGIQQGILVDKVSDYNYDVLRSLLDTDDTEEVKGVCCNYAALTAILAYYSGVNVDYITGCYGDNKFGHAWCEYTKDNNTYVIDPTLLDDTNLYNEYKENSKIDGIEEYKDELIDIILDNKTDNYKFKRKKNYKDIGYIKREKDVDYVNIGADMFNRNISDKLNRTYAIIAGIAIAIYLSSEVMDRKEKEKQKNLVNKVEE